MAHVVIPSAAQPAPSQALVEFHCKAQVCRWELVPLPFSAKSEQHTPSQCWLQEVGSPHPDQQTWASTVHTPGVLTSFLQLRLGACKALQNLVAAALSNLPHACDRHRLPVPVPTREKVLSGQPVPLWSLWTRPLLRRLLCHHRGAAVAKRDAQRPLRPLPFVLRRHVTSASLRGRRCWQKEVQGCRHVRQQVARVAVW